MPDFAIVDAHLHIYDPARLRYPWMAGEAKLQGRHEPAEFRQAAGPVAVEAAVFVEVDVEEKSQLDEVRYVEDAGDGLVRAQVAAVRLDRGADTRRHLEALGAHPSVRGVRHLVQGHVDEPGWALRPEFVDGVRMLAEFGLSFDLCIRHPQMGEAVELCRRCPETAIVLDHIGKPGIRERAWEPWAAWMAELAALPHVWCKISGAATEADHADWREDEVLPYLAHAIGSFGYERSMFGGDWPVCELATDYPRWVALVDRAAAGASGAEKRRLFRGSASAFYRLGLAP